MAVFFKTLGWGLLYTVLFPFMVALLALYAVYCTIVFLIQAIRNLIVFFSGGTVGGDLPEDVEAKRILLERAHPETKTTTTEPVATTTNTTTTTTNNIFIVADDKKIADILPGMREVSPVTPKELETTEVKAIETKEGKDD